MTTLNRAAAELMLCCNASAATDVTGFGLIGHASEMARGAGATIRLDLSSIPLMPGVVDLVNDGMVPAGCYRNRDHYLPSLHSATPLDDTALLPLFDPQTSGGLLIALSEDDAGRFLEEAGQEGVFARQIGCVQKFQTHLLEIC